ncbi:hypothetical protein [Arenibaculum pallidiluteum]|uniref:hypothetical protein n=1 Tax=Arenibaculum pallidiluteum TaxID=2812559 RepID=UPI001A95F328|nr:hypothetical protein [Arenibaculum pallidiluteum]
MKAALGRAEAVALALAVAGLSLLLWTAGRFEPWITPDTASYFDLGPLPESLGQMRNPLYGWLAAPFMAGGSSFAAIPLVQTALYFGAVCFLYATVRTYGLSLRAGASMAAALLLANVVLIWNNAVHPELPAVAFSIVGVALAFRMAAGGRIAFHAVPFGLALGLAYVLRPTFLPSFLVFPLLYLALARLRGTKAGAGRVLAVALAGALPFLAVSGARQAVVGDFNVVSFGGFQLSGMAGLMLTHEIAGELPEDLRPLAREIVDRRSAAEQRGAVIAVPRNSTGQRSFVSAALGYFDIFARTHDEVLYGVVAPLRHPGETWVAFDRRMMRLSLATLRAAPERYVAWLVGATTRFLGHAVATNAPFLLALLGLAVLFPLHVWRGAPASAGTASTQARPAMSAQVHPDISAQVRLDVNALLCLTLLYAVSAGILMVVVTFPALRYIDTAALFLPTLPFYALLGLARGTRRRPDVPAARQSTSAVRNEDGRWIPS